MKAAVAARSLKALAPFRIARGVSDAAHNVFLTLEEDGRRGYGETAPRRIYGEDVFGVVGRLEALGPWLSSRTVESPDDVRRLWGEARPMLAPSLAALCALDLALWDLLGKKWGASVSRLVWGSDPKALETSCSLGISPPEEWEARVEAVRRCRFVKLKSDERADVSLPAFVRARSDARLRIDANGSWGGLDAAERIERFAALGAELVEQPLPPDADDRMGGLSGRSPIPILADESCVREEDVERMPGRFAGINVKLVKCGGLTPALRMLEHARALHLRVMAGCMLESSLLIAAGAVLGQRADYVDLDGAWLLAEDAFAGVRLTDGRLELPAGPGFGVTPA